ncbi:MAG: hypothetical protein WCO96_10560, partial [Actinomycetes bacterium]
TAVESAGAATAATVVASGRQIKPREPAQASPPAAPTPARQPNTARRRLVALVAVVALLVAGAVSAIALTQPESGGPKVRAVTGDDASQAIQSMRDLVDSNTR